MLHESEKNRSKTNHPGLAVEILESISDAFFALDRSWRFIYVNQRAASDLGLKREELIGQMFWDRFNRVLGTQYEVKYREAMSEGKPQEFEMRGILTDLWYNIRVYPSTEGISVYWLDITARKQAEEKYRQLSAIVESSDDAIIGKTLEGIITSWNKGAEKIYGYTAPEVIGKSIAILSSPGNEDNILRNLDRIRRGEYIHQHETLHLKKDGKEFPTILTISPILDEGGKIIGSSTIVQDITRRKQVEDQLRQRTEELEIVMDTAPVAILLGHDPECHYISGNPAASALYEAKAGENFSAGPPPGEPAIQRRFFRNGKELTAEELPMQQAAALNADIQGSEFEVILPSGKSLDLLASASPLRGEDGRVRGVVAAFLDITGRKKAEEDLKRYTAELEVANRELESFSYSVSHDLRAPLRSLDGFSLAILEDYADKLDERGQGYLDRIRQASQRMSDLINDLLSLSRLSRSELHFASVNLSEIAQSVLKELKNTQPDRTAEFAIASDIIVNGDKSLLTIALQNLLGNSWKFTGKSPQTRIEFGVSDRNGERVYFVKDNGAGFNMQYKDKLFQPFQRLHSSKEYEGTGIGLAIVQRVMRRHSGRVWAESEQGQGATFYFTLG